MELLKETAVNIAVCSIISAVVLAFVGKESSQKAVRILLSMTLITVIAIPFTSSKEIGNEIFRYYEEAQADSYYYEKERLNENVLKKYELALEELIGEILKGRGVSDYRVRVRAKGYGEYGINITSVSIYLKDEYKEKQEEIIDAVYDEINIKAEINYD